MDLSDFKRVDIIVVLHPKDESRKVPQYAQAVMLQGDNTFNNRLMDSAFESVRRGLNRIGKPSSEV